MLLFFAKLFYHPRYSRINDLLLQAYETLVVFLLRVLGGKHILAVHVLSRYRYNPFLTKPDVRVTVRDSAAVAPAQRAIHALKRLLPLLDVVEIYTLDERRTQETLLATPSGQLSPLLDRWRALQRCRTKKSLLKLTESYEHFKTDVFAEELSVHPTLEQLTDRLLQQIESELGLRIPALETEESFFCPYLGQQLYSAAGPANRFLVLLACLPPAHKGSSSLSRQLAQIRIDNPAIEEVFSTLNEIELLKVRALVRGERRFQDWHQSWPRALEAGLLKEAEQPFCSDPFNRVRVTAEGDVFLCCFQRKTPIGNLLSSSMEEIWDSPLAREIRESTARGVMHKTCLVPCPKAYVPKVKCSTLPEQTPLYLDIDPPNTHCNVGGKKPTLENPACIMCERSVDDYRFEDDKSLAVLPKLTPILPKIKIIHVQGVSEVFWQDLLFKYLEVLQFAPFKNAIALSTTSNATVFPPKKQEKWLASAAHTGISFSIDAASASTYEKIRILPVYETVLNNIRSYSRLVADRPQHRFRIQNNINTLNLHEVRDMVAFAAEVKADEIEFNLTGGHRTEILINDKNRADFIQAYEDATDQGQKSGIKVVFLRPC